jgi:hypothetical protein
MCPLISKGHFSEIQILLRIGGVLCCGRAGACDIEKSLLMTVIVVALSVRGGYT